jgi:hypothetical protein
MSMSMFEAFFCYKPPALLHATGLLISHQLRLAIDLKLTARLLHHLCY